MRAALLFSAATIASGIGIFLFADSAEVATLGLVVVFCGAAQAGYVVSRPGTYP